MLGQRLNVLAALALLVAGAMAKDLSEEMADGFRMGLRPRAAANLQAFSSALGGAKASAVRYDSRPLS